MKAAAVALAVGIVLSVLSVVVPTVASWPGNYQLSWDERATWPTPTPSRWPECQYYQWATSFGVHRESWQAQGAVTSPSTSASANGIFMIHRTESGYPFKCAANEYWVECVFDNVKNVPIEYVYDDHPIPSFLEEGILIDTNTDKMMVIPTRPLWGGVVLNIAIYAAMILVARATFVVVRSSRRRRRDLCTVCGYSLQGVSTVCPECGENPK